MPDATSAPAEPPREIDRVPVEDAFGAVDLAALPAWVHELRGQALRIIYASDMAGSTRSFEMRVD